jgi:hypothetical protein
MGSACAAMAGRPNSLDDFIFEGDAFGIIGLEPSFRSLGIGECFDVIGMANLISGVDVNPNGLHLDSSYGRVLLAVVPFLPLALLKALHDRRAPWY